jgi:hypothetical protein
VHGDAHSEAERVKRIVEERIRQDAVVLGARGRADLELRGVGLGRACSEDDLSARDSKRVEHHVRGRFPQPVADLVVERLHLARFDDMDVVAQAVEELRAVGLRVERLQLVMLDEDIVQAPVDYRAVDVRSGTDGMIVAALGALPDPGKATKRTEVRERDGVSVRLSVDVGSVRSDRVSAHRKQATSTVHSPAKTRPSCRSRRPPVSTWRSLLGGALERSTRREALDLPFRRRWGAAERPQRVVWQDDGERGRLRGLGTAAMKTVQARLIRPTQGVGAARWLCHRRRGGPDEKGCAEDPPVARRLCRDVGG